MVTVHMIATMHHIITLSLNPGAKLEDLHYIINGTANQEYDNFDAVVIHGGTNNIVNDIVPETIIKADNLIEDSLVAFPRSTLIISGIIQRTDKPHLNRKIEAINNFLNHKCEHHPRLIYLNNRNCNNLTDQKGLHLCQFGKKMLASNVLNCTIASNNSYPFHHMKTSQNG